MSISHRCSSAWNAMSDSLLGRVVKKRGAAAVIARLGALGALSQLKYDWRAMARPEQLAPAGAWLWWLIVAGRGFGKTRTGAEWVRAEVESERRGRLALLAP